MVNVLLLQKYLADEKKKTHKGFWTKSHAYSEDRPGECRVASSMEKEQHRTTGATAVESENVQWSYGNKNRQVFFN